MRRLCGPLAYLHGEGLVHRDLKPDNILLRVASSERAAISERGGHVATGRALATHNSRLATPWPVLADFGLAASVPGADGREALELEGIGAGTVLYMAPEQIRGAALDARADLYALGCVLYELLAGRPPFVGTGAQAVLRGHLYEEPRPPSELAGPLPEGLDELVLRLLAKSPRQRLGHAEDVGRALEALGAEAEPWPEAPRAQPYLYRPGLAGREEPLAELEAALGRLEAGEGGMLFLAGESGVGKTRLLLELSRKAQRRQVQVLAGECVPGGIFSGSESARAPRGRSDRSPFPTGDGGPLEALRKPLQSVADRCRERGAAETRRLLGRRGKVLATYVPELSGLPGHEAYPEPAELPADAARLRLFSYLTETFEALAQDGPLLMMLDDLQWADDLTLGFLQHWLRVQTARAQPVGRQPAPGGQPVGRQPAPEGQPEARAGQTGPPPAAAGGQAWARAGQTRTPPTAAGGQAAELLLIVGTYRSEEVGEALQRLITFCAPAARLAHPSIEEPAERSAEKGDDAPGRPEEAAGTVSWMPHLQLGRLEEPAIASMVGDMLALSPPPVLFARHLGRYSEGNPFFVSEYLRAAVDAGLLWRDQQGLWQVADRGEEKATAATYEALVLPQTLRELVGRRIEGLSTAARKVVRAAAVLGRESGLELLESMVRLGEGKLLDALSELLRRQVLEVPSPGRVRFVHDKIREVAYANLGKARRKKLHHAAAGAIESVHATDLTEYQAPLARHWDEAGDPEKARPCYLSAARKAVQKFDHAEAERLYRAHLRLVPEPSRESVTARNELGKGLNLRGRNEEAMSEHGRAVEEARLVGDRHNEAKGLRALGLGYQQTGRMKQARQLFEQALAIHRELGDRKSEGDMLGDLGCLHGIQGRPEQAQQLHEQALAIHRELGNRRSEGIALSNLGVLEADRGQPEFGLRLHEQALAVHREVGNRHAEGIVLGSVGILHLEQGRSEAAQRAYEQALAVLREVGARRSEAIVLGNLGGLHVELGRSEFGLQLCEQALAIHREVGNRQTEGVVLDTLGLLHAQLGRPELGLRLFEQALAIYREVGDKRSEGIELDNLGLLHAKLGRPELGLRLCEQALAIDREVGNQRSEGIELGSLGFLARLATGDLARAGRLAEQDEELLTATGNQPALGKLLCEKGHIELAGGSSGRGSLQRVRDLVEAVGAGPDSELGRAISKLRRAVEAFEAGEQHRLFRGELIEDIPEGLRRWLRETGQL